MDHKPAHSITPTLGRSLLLVAALLAGAVTAGEPDLKPAWPQVNGPFGNFNPRQYGCKLVDDLSQAKAVWTSEDDDLGYGKTSSGGGAGVKSIWPGHPGSVNALIAAEGMIFASSFRPAGEVWAEEFGKGVRDGLSPERQARLRSNTRIDADDFVVAIDQATGKTLWKTIEERRGFFRAMGKRGGWGVSPAYHAGKVFSMGTTGRLYCYDSKTGKKVWESDIGKTHQAWEADKKQSLEKRILPTGGQQISLIVADGVLIVPLYDGMGNVSLGGVDVQTGKMLWQVAQATAPTATPALWRHDGREYVVAATTCDASKREAKLRLISPRDGKVLWTVDGIADTHFSLAPSEKHVVVNVASKTTTGTAINGHDANKFWMLLGCYRSAPNGNRRTRARRATTYSWSSPTPTAVSTSAPWTAPCAATTCANRKHLKHLA